MAAQQVIPSVVAMAVRMLIAVSKPVVKREILPGKYLDDKRIVRYEVDESQLTEEHYFCDTLEPTWRNLLGIDLKLKPEEVDARYSRQSGKKARKIPGKTAVPEGSYPVFITKSPRFKAWLPVFLKGIYILERECKSYS